MTIFFRYIDKELKERHRKKSVIQMKNGAPVYDSEEGTEEEPVPQTAVSCPAKNAHCPPY